MRRFLIVPALMISLLLTGCGGAAGAEQRIEKQRDAFAAAEKISFSAHCTSSPGGGEVFVCELNCSADALRTAVEVVSPASVAGITATAHSGETVLSYDGVQLSVGTVQTSGPLNAMPLLTEALRGGSVLRAWREREAGTGLLAADYFCEAEETELTVWFDETELLPIHAELRCDGESVLECEIHNFSYT